MLVVVEQPAWQWPETSFFSKTCNVREHFLHNKQKQQHQNQNGQTEAQESTSLQVMHKHCCRGAGEAIGMPGGDSGGQSPLSIHIRLSLSLPTHWPLMLITRFSCNPAQSHNPPYRKYLLSFVHSPRLMVSGIPPHLCLAGVAYLHGYTVLCKYGQITCSVCVQGDGYSVES